MSYHHAYFHILSIHSSMSFYAYAFHPYTSWVNDSWIRRCMFIQANKCDFLFMLYFYTHASAHISCSFINIWCTSCMPCYLVKSYISGYVIFAWMLICFIQQFCHVILKLSFMSHVKYDPSDHAWPLFSCSDAVYMCAMLAVFVIICYSVCQFTFLSQIYQKWFFL